MPGIQVIKLFCDGDKKFPILEMLEFLQELIYCVDHIFMFAF